MEFTESFKSTLFKIDDHNFNDQALELFDFQYNQNPLYQNFCQSLGRNPKNVRHIDRIPFLPIDMFKNHVVKSGAWKPQKVFLSSGTTNNNRSQHHIRDLTWYQLVSRRAFELVYGKLSDYQIFTLLPSYEEQGASSLIYMVQHFIEQAEENSCFLKKSDLSALTESLHRKKLFIGVSYALLDAIQELGNKDEHLILMETGGMKGRRKEMTRMELHQNLAKGYDVRNVHSEYGMTELLSQAYARSSGQFKFPAWCKVLIREINDPFSYLQPYQTGGINVIDMANIDTCSFIETSDLGKKINSELFEVLGRFDNSDVRGCNLLAEFLK